MRGVTVVISVYQGGKQKFREVKSHAQGHKASQCHSHDPNPSVPPKPKAHWRTSAVVPGQWVHVHPDSKSHGRSVLCILLSVKAPEALTHPCVLVSLCDRARWLYSADRRASGKAEGGGRLPWGLYWARAPGCAGLPLPVPVHLPEAEVCVWSGNSFGSAFIGKWARVSLVLAAEECTCSLPGF